MTLAATILLMLLLGASAALKARRAESAAAGLATYGIGGASVRRVSLSALVTVELVLAGSLASGSSWALVACALLFLGFALAALAALLAGRGGRPCACFGGDSRLSWASPVRAAALATVAAAAAADVLPRAPTSYQEWLTAGLCVSIAAVAALGLAVLALAREVGVLRLGASAGRGALEIPEEGPPVGRLQPWAAATLHGPRVVLRLAVFTSEGCPLCRQLAPAVEHVASDPVLAVRIYDEGEDAAVWRAAKVPGSPYAVALSLDGVTLAKGSFNTLAQLESILGTARERERETPLAA
jgi:hypothetical protein